MLCTLRQSKKLWRNFLDLRFCSNSEACVSRGLALTTTHLGQRNYRRKVQITFSRSKSYNVPPSAEFVARVSGIATMGKLPYQDTAEGLDAAFVGVPIDTGTSNRPGARYKVYSASVYFVLLCTSIVIFVIAGVITFYEEAGHCRRLHDQQNGRPIRLVIVWQS